MKNKIKKLLLGYPVTLRFLVFLYGTLIGVLGFSYRLLYVGRCSIALSARFTGWRNIKIGNNVVICSGVWMNINHRKSKEIGIVIGENCFIGENNFFSSGILIDLGPFCLTTTGCSFIGASHIIDDVFEPYIASGVTKKNTIKIGPNCFFGYNSSVVGNVCIGHGSVIGANSVVLSDIPPFSMVVGNPARVIKRFDFVANSWSSDEVNENNQPSEDDYLHHLNRTNNVIVMPSILKSKYFSSII
jgi:acetyltransferase-like isoleucine patch superfamily enzyme